MSRDPRGAAKDREPGERRWAVCWSGGDNVRIGVGKASAKVAKEGCVSVDMATRIDSSEMLTLPKTVAILNVQQGRLTIE